MSQQYTYGDLVGPLTGGPNVACRIQEMLMSHMSLSLIYADVAC